MKALFELRFLFFFLLGMQLTASLSFLSPRALAAEGNERGFVGEVVSRDGSNLTLKDGELQVSFPLARDVRVTRNFFEGSIQDIEKGDRVALVQGDNGEALSLKGIDGQLQEMLQWGLPLSAAAAVAFIVLSVLVRKLQSRFQPQVFYPNQQVFAQ